MFKETATNQPKPALVFIDEASADPNRSGFRSILLNPNYRVYVTSPKVGETRNRLYGSVGFDQILPVRSVRIQEHLGQGIEYQPAIDILYPRKTNLGTALKDCLCGLVSQTLKQPEQPWESLLIFGQQPARPLDIKNVLFIMDNRKRPTQFDKVLTMADLLRMKALKLGKKSALEGWQQYPIGDTYIHEIGEFIHTYEQIARNQRAEFIRISTLAIMGSHLSWVDSSNVSARTPEPTSA